MEITDFKIDQVWVPNHGQKISDSRTITSVVNIIYKDKPYQYIVYNEPIVCPSCDTLIRREERSENELDEFISWIKHYNAICISDSEYIVNQLESAKAANNSLQAEILQLKATIEDLERKIEQA